MAWDGGLLCNPWSMHDAPIHGLHINFLKPNDGHFVYLRWKFASLEKQTLFQQVLVDIPFSERYSLSIK